MILGTAVIKDTVVVPSEAGENWTEGTEGSPQTQALPDSLPKLQMCVAYWTVAGQTDTAPVTKTRKVTELT